MVSLSHCMLLNRVLFMSGHAAGCAAEVWTHMPLTARSAVSIALQERPDPVQDQQQS